MSLSRDAGVPTEPISPQQQESLDVAQMSVIPIGEVRYLKPRGRKKKNIADFMTFPLTSAGRFSPLAPRHYDSSIAASRALARLLALERATLCFSSSERLSCASPSATDTMHLIVSLPLLGAKSRTEFCERFNCLISLCAKLCQRC